MLDYSMNEIEICLWRVAAWSWRQTRTSVGVSSCTKLYSSKQRNKRLAFHRFLCFDTLGADWRLMSSEGFALSEHYSGSPTFWILARTPSRDFITLKVYAWPMGRRGRERNNRVMIREVMWQIRHLASNSSKKPWMIPPNWDSNEFADRLQTNVMYL